MVLFLITFISFISSAYAGQAVSAPVVNTSKDEGDLPIHLAAKKAKDLKTFQAFMKLVDEKAPLNIPNKQGDLPIHIISKRLNLKENNTEIALCFLTFLVMAKSPVNVPDQTGDLPIHIFSRKLSEALGESLSAQLWFNWVETFEEFLIKYSPLNLKNKAGDLPIDILEHHQTIDFSVERRDKIIQMLLKSGSPHSKWEHEQH